MRMFFRDVAFAARTLRNNLAFALTAIATLALGIGATTAIFSVVNSVLLRPLPYDHPERLTIIWGELRTRKVYDWLFSPGDLKDLMDQATLFEGLAAVDTNPCCAHRRRRAAAADPDCCRDDQHLLRARCEDRRAGAVSLTKTAARSRACRNPMVRPQAQPAGPPPQRLPQIAVLSDGFWRRQYGADPSIIGKNIQLDFGPVQVVGVLAPGVELLFPPKANLARVPDVWTAIRFDFAADVLRTNVCCFVIGRMKATTSLAAAQQQVERVAADLRTRFAIKQSVDHHFRVESMKENVVATVKPTIRALMGAVIFVLLIACANVANLLLVRASGRDRELAVRAALGGSQWALTRQLLAESLVLAGAGGLLGLVLRVLRHRPPAQARAGGPAAHDGCVDGSRRARVRHRRVCRCRRSSSGSCPRCERRGRIWRRRCAPADEARPAVTARCCGSRW